MRQGKTSRRLGKGWSRLGSDQPHMGKGPRHMGKGWTGQEAMALFVREVEQRGCLQGRRTTVLRLLRRKFGELPETIVTRIQAAETEALEQIEDKLLFAKTLDEVFAVQGTDMEAR